MSRTPDNSSSPTKRLLFVGWDAADWQMIDPLIEAGKMPNLAKLIEGGVMASLATLHPVVSPMLWTSIATGKLAFKHGIYGFNERNPEGGARPSTSISRKTKAIWNIFQQALGWRCNVAGWWASYPAEPLEGASISNVFFHAQRRPDGNWNVPPHAVHPPELTKELLPLIMGINEIDETLVRPFIPRAAEIDQKNDERLEVFCRLLAECISVQSVVTNVMERAPWDFTSVYFNSIDHFAHAFIPFHPPRMPHVDERDFEIYSPIMAGVYQFHDMLLGRLIDLAGPGATTVLCSDHGFQSGRLRPVGNPREPVGPVIWHREFGILVMNGPGIKRDERIYGANLLDVAPTLLTLAGLPVGRDMDGKPLLEALENPKVPEPIASWDDVPGNDGCHPPGYVLAAPDDASKDLMKQFVDLGYVDDPGDDLEKAAVNSDRENNYNLAEVFLSTGRTEEAIALLEPLVAEASWETRYLHQLANAYLKGGYFQAALDLLDRAYPPEEREAEPPIVVWQMWAKAKLRLGDRQGAAHYLRYATNRMRRSPGLWVESGWLWYELGDLTACEHCFRRAIELDADAAAALQGLSSLYLRQRKNALAIDAAYEAVQKLYHLPIAHRNLGIGLAREGQLDEALVAFRRAVDMRPRMIEAHRWLAAIYGQKDRDSFHAGIHRNEARRLGRERAFASQGNRFRAKTPRALPQIPSTAERDRLGAEARPLPKATSSSGRTFILVSGLPRSGTSMMMMMLQAAGLPARTDDIRAADIDNPEGYFEWEAIKRIAQEPHLLDEPGLERKSIKVISALLPALPRAHSYRVIYMSRPVEEIVASQVKMIGRRGTTGMQESPQKMAEILREHSNSILSLARAQSKNFEVLEVDYPSLVSEPNTWIKRIVDFVGTDLLPHPERMPGVVRKDLHRNRHSG